MYSRIITDLFQKKTTREDEGTGYLRCGQVRSHMLYLIM